MSIKNTFAIFLFFISQLAICQTEKWIHGKIIVKDATPKGVRIVNLNNETETFSDIRGEFDIKAKIDDLLIFPSDHLDYQRKIIEAKDYETVSIIVEMTSKVTRLEEVVITRQPKIDALTLGIIPTSPKKYTQAERRLRTARSSSLDLITNTFSGRMKSLKNDIKIEKEISDLAYLSELYDDEYYINQLKIDPSLIKGFQYYAIGNKDLTSALHSKNKALISFVLVRLSMDYNLLQQSDKH